jgi:hypothetical protein
MRCWTRADQATVVSGIRRLIGSRIAVVGGALIGPKIPLNPDANVNPPRRKMRQPLPKTASVTLKVQFDLS